jgi:hypothetical protein
LPVYAANAEKSAAGKSSASGSWRAQSRKNIRSGQNVNQGSAAVDVTSSNSKADTPKPIMKAAVLLCGYDVKLVRPDEAKVFSIGAPDRSASH